MRNVVKRLLALGLILLLFNCQRLTIMAAEAEGQITATIEEVTPEVLTPAAESVPVEQLEMSLQEPETEVAEAVGTDQPAEVVIYYQPGDAELLVRIAEVEYRDCPSAAHVAAVMWTVLNRVDSPLFRQCTVRDVIYAPKKQFAAGAIGAVPRRDDWLWIAQDVLDRWNAERNGLVDPSNSGRVIPPEVIYFKGDGHWNHFRDGVGREYAIDTEGSPYGY